METNTATYQDRLLSQVQKIIVKQLGVDVEEVTPKALVVHDLGADSLDTVELIMAFEKAYELEIPDEDAETVRTVQDVVDYLVRKKVKLAEEPD